MRRPIIWLLNNYKPTITGQDPAIWRRPKPISFPVGFQKPGEQLEGDYVKVLDADTDLEAKLRKQLKGILAWSVRGAVTWFNRGKPTLRQCIEVDQEVRTYRREEDALGEFIEERCEKGKHCTAEFNALAHELNNWLELRNQHRWSPKTISQRLKHAGFVRQGKGKRHPVLGVRLKPTIQQVKRDQAKKDKSASADGVTAARTPGD